MAKNTKPLSPTEVKQAKAKDKSYKLFDGFGLVLKVRTNGSKSWVFIYNKPFIKKRAELAFGTYPNIGLAAARILRDKARELLAKDIDPKEHKDALARHKTDQLSNTLEQVATNWFQVKNSEISPDHAKDLWRSLELHIFPALAKKPISKISAPIVIDVLKPIAAKGSLETVKRLTQRLNEIMNYAVNTGLIHANPLTGIKAAFKKPEKQNMPTLSPSQLPELMTAISYASIKIVTRCLIEWQLHTMVRPTEAAGAKWSEIDLENKLWVIPAERMKKKREHAVPLTKQTIELLERLQPISGHREYIFPADRNPRLHINSSTANMALKRMGFHQKLVAHGMRALASTTLNEQGFDGDVIEAALAHVDKNEVRRAYNRAEYLERRQILMTWWSEHIEQAKTGKVTISNQGLKVVGL
ncbi:integrase domain-containing protein [uncultured Paraglaciecola sp.]|uniref:integrase domain-containing protein n=1 Tax=uncultured Paraglaciecola sp. TaxID=1765024 RepID=UPI00262E649E|nr:integrase domain-containing protein [uncultured Paraglaciecola sp.]